MEQTEEMIKEADRFDLDQPRWRTWRELTLVMLMIMEVCWVVPWFRSLTQATFSVDPGLAFVIFLGLILSAHLISRLFNYLRLKIVIRQSLLVLILILCVLIGFHFLLYPGESDILALVNRPIQSFADWGVVIPNEFIVAIAVIISWWRGIALAQAHVGPHLVMNNFIIGILLFFCYGFVNTMVTGETPGVLLYVFIFASLLAMSSSRMFIIHTLRGGGAGVFDRRWFIGITSAAFIVVFIASLSASIFGDGAGIAGLLISGLFFILSRIIYLLLLPILFLLVWFLDSIPLKSGFVEALSTGLENVQQMMSSALNNLGNLTILSKISEVMTNWGPNIKAIIFWGIIILAISGAVLLIGLQLWRDRKRDLNTADQQSILDAGEIWKLLRSALESNIKDLWGNLSNLSVLSNRRRLFAAERIRQIYVELMDLCQELDNPRPEAATPIEFMPKVVALFPKYREEIEVITQAYNRIRYGQLPEKKSEISTVENAWNRIEQEGHLLIESKKRIKKPPEVVSGGLKS